jgi:hypothetical protein
MQKAINLLFSFLCSEGSDFSRMFHDDYAVGIFFMYFKGQIEVIKKQGYDLVPTLT